MIDYKQLTAGTVGTCVSAIAINVDDIRSIESIVGIVCTVIGLIITTISCVVIPLIRWWKNAKADKKITADEVEEGLKTLRDGLSEVKDQLEHLDEHKDEEKGEDHNDSEKR